MYDVTRYFCSRGPLGASPDSFGIGGRFGRTIGPLGLDGPDDEPAFEDDSLCRCFLGARGLSPAPTPAALSAAPDEVEVLKTELVRICNEEWARWNVPRRAGRGTRRMTERQGAMLGVLQDYWQTGLNLRYTATQLGDLAWQDEHPWSAAFICWVMRRAGAGDRFRYGAMHSRYIAWAKQNRETNADSWFKAYRLSEAVPAPGDLVCKARAGSGSTYENIREGMKTHCDYVTEVEDDHLVTIGGNVGNSVSKTIVSIDDLGHVTQSGYFAVIKIEE